MNFRIHCILLIWHLYYEISPISTLNIVKQSKCDFKHTVNLTNYHKYQNDSFLYQGKIIPPEILALYDYAVLWGKNKSVPLHVRGCVCDRYPCIRLCCEKDEYYDEITKNCEKLNKDIEMLWKLRIEHFSGKFKISNIMNEFIIEIGLPCLESMTLKKIEDTTTLFQTGFLQTPYNRFESSEFCYSPHLTNNFTYILKPFTCLPDNNTFRKGTFTLMKFLTTWKSWTNIEVQGFISLLFLISTTLLYYFLKDLRKNLSGKLYFCYLYGMTMSYIIFAILNLTHFLWSRIWIIIIGFTGLVIHTIAILWLNVFGYYIWRDRNSKANSKLFSIYCVIVGSIACLASCFIIFGKMSESYLVNSGGILDKILWWNNQRWFSLQIIIPTVLILLFNCGKLILLTIIITRRRDSGTHNKLFLKKNAIIFIRLFVILVIPWFFKIYLPSIADAMQGTIIFLSSVLRKEIWILLKMKFKMVRIPHENVIDTESLE
ncbi:probable G-protein coupled receptor Mth-like 3 [Lucilia sericata]|uniref:probable G-protein coupled receptor Mth-like 3 n=1 Tax=Lucilia sericata TaxID=13632 RepID=UPI0018A867CD|nr:probable G-protein coupled receptor Mth-like 3 [Lucilia sericata]